LDAVARPRDTDQSGGRFLACASGFYDPAVYEKGREITVVGLVEAPETRRIGEYEYQCARVKAEHVYLWAKRQPYPTEVYVINPWGWPPYWGAFGRPSYPYWW
jgi:outer membrane lipoprotein